MTKSDNPADPFKKALPEASKLLANVSEVNNDFAHTGFNLPKNLTTLLPL